MHTSTLTRVAGMALAAVMLVLTSGLVDAKLPAPTKKQKAQADPAKAKAARGDRVVTFQTCKAQDKAVASCQADGRAAHTQPSVPCVDPGLFVASVPVASAPVSAVKG